MAHLVSQSLHRKLDIIQESQYDTLGSFCLLDKTGKYLAYNRTTLDWIGLSQSHDLHGKGIEQTPWAQHKEQLHANNKKVYKYNSEMRFFEYVLGENNELILATTQKKPFYHQNKLIGLQVRGIRIPYDLISQTHPFSDKTVFVDTRANRILTITPQRRESLYMLLQGLNFREIAELRDLSPRTVEHHIEHVRNKYGYRTVRDILLHVRVF